jgi:hypothetical protein
MKNATHGSTNKTTITPGTTTNKGSNLPGTGSTTGNWNANNAGNNRQQVAGKTAPQIPTGKKAPPGSH